MKIIESFKYNYLHRSQNNGNIFLNGKTMTFTLRSCIFQGCLGPPLLINIASESLATIFKP